ncbi:MAG TPA: hypothetical protein DCY13_08645, partial [Verrucomicrobiales bacterium]|nr:hypothetical protein [Verrucomicrobiales bacterium]
MSEELNRGKRRRWLRWTGYLALAGLGLIALGLAMSLWSQAKGKRLLAAEVARIKAEGIELDWRKLKPPTEEDETAKLVIEVGDRLRTTNLRRGFPPAAPMIGPGIFLPMIDRSGWEFMNFSKGQMTTNHASWDTFEAAIAPHMDDLNEVSEALAIAPPAFALDRSSYPESRTRHDGAALELTSWLRADGLRHLRAGRAVQAHGSLLALLNLSEGTAGTKTPFSVIVATTVQNQAWGLLLECVGKVNWTPEQWRQTQNGFDLVDWTGTGRQVLELETAAGWHLFERIRADVSVATNLVTFSTPNWWDSARDSALDHVGSAAPGFGEWVGHRIEAGELWWTERVCTSFWRNHWLSEDAIAFLQRSHLAHRSLRQLPDDAALTRFARTNDWDNWMAAYD